MKKAQERNVEIGYLFRLRKHLKGMLAGTNPMTFQMENGLHAFNPRVHPTMVAFVLNL
jgi:hypothetical protein